jgi:hypothetical protein
MEEKKSLIAFLTSEHRKVEQETDLPRFRQKFHRGIVSLIICIVDILGD